MLQACRFVRPQALLTGLYRLSTVWAFKNCNTSSPSCSQRPVVRIYWWLQCTVFDFQPSNPEDVCTAFIALSGGIIPGIVLEREIFRLPARRCWLVGKTVAGLGIQDAVEFNKQWDSQLQLWKHDCRHHTDALVEFLTGEKEILQKLKNRPSG